jgi:hypothetical protein
MVPWIAVGNQCDVDVSVALACISYNIRCWIARPYILRPRNLSQSRGWSRPPIGLARMPRVFVSLLCFGLSDEGIEEAIYDSQAIRAVVGIDAGRESALDAITLPKFRRLLDSKELTHRNLDTINGHLDEKVPDDARADHRRRDADRRATIDKKQIQLAPSGDAPIEEWQSLACRDGRPHRHRCSVGPRAHSRRRRRLSSRRKTPLNSRKIRDLACGNAEKCYRH